MGCKEYQRLVQRQNDISDKNSDFSKERKKELFDEIGNSIIWHTNACSICSKPKYEKKVIKPTID